MFAIRVTRESRRVNDLVFELSETGLEIFLYYGKLPHKGSIKAENYTLKTCYQYANISDAISNLKNRNYSLRALNFRHNEFRLNYHNIVSSKCVKNNSELIDKIVYEIIRRLELLDN